MTQIFQKTMIQPRTSKMVDTYSILSTLYLARTMIFGAKKVGRIHGTLIGEVLILIIQFQPFLQHIVGNDRRIGCHIKATILHNKLSVIILV